MTGNNMILIGMPGAGKSTIGVLSAKALGKAFIDTDLLIQEAEGRLLQEIIDRSGIGAFLAIEEVILSQLQTKNSVIATGGSAVYSEAAMKHLKNSGIVIYLRLSLDAVAERIRNIATRGIVLAEGQSLGDLFHERVPLYERYADLVLDCSEQSIEETVQAAVQAYRDYPRPSRAESLITG